MAGRAVYIDAPESLRVAPVEPRAPEPGEALVRVAWAGICGSDREVLAGRRAEGFVRYPVIPGHEWSGTVVETGSPNDAELVGKPVVGEGFRSCQRCDACRRGDTNLCSAAYDETGFTQPGAWSDHLMIPARLLHPLPEGSDLRAAAALEPAACVAAACLKAQAVPGERIAVVGAGTLGLLATQLLRAGGPGELTVVEPREDRRALAEACGATTFVSPEQAAPHAGTFDVVVETAGASGAGRLATGLARRGGRVVLTGLAAEDREPLASADLVLGAVTVHTVFGAPSRAWSHVVRAFASGALDPSVIITHEVGLDDVAEAFRILADQRAGAVKVLLRP
jgi:2-desacetyl-2-hydroxyethyl bacteriochlorophyllide A dehydrogenase